MSMSCHVMSCRCSALSRASPTSSSWTANRMLISLCSPADFTKATDASAATSAACSVGVPLAPEPNSGVVIASEPADFATEKVFRYELLRSRRHSALAVPGQNGGTVRMRPFSNTFSNPPLDEKSKLSGRAKLLSERGLIL